MADCAINVEPTEDELIEICADTITCAKAFNVTPKVAFLSYSTNGSGKGESVTKMHNAAQRAKALYPMELIEGEMQMDAAVSPNVAKLKYPNSKVAGYANTFLCPDVQSANIGYKIAARMGNFNVYGPILLGLDGKISGLSRSCNGQEVYIMAVCTAAGAGIEWE
jgi:phosphate acetyltransferase